MTSYIALLRAINVGGRGKVAMSDLRELFEGLGFEDVRSLLQTGNVVFEGGARKATALEALLEREASAQLGLRTDFLLRTAAEWKGIVAGNPFPDEAKSDPGHLVVIFLKNAPKPADVRELQASITGPEVIRAKGRQLYVTYPDGIGRSKLTNARMDKALGTRGTGRNWSTVIKIRDLVAR
jgi:uncharacterized protein (DUF1697 family)